MVETPPDRVVIACVTFETVKIVDPIKKFKADRVFLLFMPGKKVYEDFYHEVIRQLEGLKILYTPVEMEILDFPSVMKELIRIVRQEHSKGNHVSVNISSGSRIFSAAALITCMQEGATPFDVHTKKYWIEEEAYYKSKNRPIGLSEEVGDPIFIPRFKIHPPKGKLLLGLLAWKEISLTKRKVHQTKVIEAMAQKGLMEDIYFTNHRGKELVKHGAKMSFICCVA